MRLLIIDQNAESVSALCEALGNGHAAVVTGNWLEALSHLKTGCFEAALMNFDSSGFPGLKFVLSRLPELYPQICFIAYGEGVAVQQARRHGTVEVLLLPFTSEKLRQALAIRKPAPVLGSTARRMPRQP